eukprot:7033674-Pyramimonas_sp.AAC.1
MRRVLTSPFAARVLPLVRRCWDLMQQQARRGHDLRTFKPNDGGPMARLKSIFADIGWAWPQADALRRANGQYVYLTRRPQGWWQHVLREVIRRWIWKSDVHLLERKDMQGMKHGINYHIATSILKKADNAAIREDEDEDEEPK